MKIKWFQKKRAVQVQIIQRDRCKLRMETFRADQALAKAAAEKLADPYVALMIDVLHNENPSGFVLDSSVPMETRALHQARIEGYTLCLTNLESLASHEKTAEPLTATFEPAEQ